MSMTRPANTMERRAKTAPAHRRRPALDPRRRQPRPRFGAPPRTAAHRGGHKTTVTASVGHAGAPGCHVKETFLGPRPPDRLTVSVPGTGTRLIGEALQTDVHPGGRRPPLEAFLPYVSATPGRNGTSPGSRNSICPMPRIRRSPPIWRHFSAISSSVLRTGSRRFFTA